MVRSLTMRPDAHIHQGVTLADASWTQSSETVINAVRAHSNSSSGAGFSGIRIDDDPASPTFVDREFDMNVGYYASELFTSDAQCRHAARAQCLLQSRNVETIEITCALMPRLETGDRVNVSAEGRLFEGVIANLSFDAFGAGMTITLALAKVPEGEAARRPSSRIPDRLTRTASTWQTWQGPKESARSLGRTLSPSRGQRRRAN